MAQILNNPGGFGAQFGANLGTGISQGLNALAQYKINQKLENNAYNQQSKFWESLGYEPDVSSYIVRAPDYVQKALLERGNPNQQPSSQQTISEGLGGALNQFQMPEQQEQQGQLTPEQIQQYLQGMHMQQLQQRPQLPAQNLQELLSNLGAQNSAPLPPSPNQQLAPAIKKEQAIKQESKKPAISLKALPSDLDTKKELEDYKSQLKEKHYSKEKLDKEIDKSKDWLSANNKKYKALKKQEARLDRVEELTLKGELDSPLFVASLDTIAHGLWGTGINLKSLQNPDSAEFEKLSNDMLSGIQDVFGSRILKTEVDTFLKTIPTLIQSDEGKLRVIQNLKLLNEADMATHKIAKDIINKNDGKVPADLEFLVDQELDSYLDDWADRFKNQARKTIPEKTYFQQVAQRGKTIGRTIKNIADYIKK